jgi:hypothetical protein
MVASNLYLPRLSDSGAEVTHLETEIARKETQIEKLTIAQPAAIAAQAKVNSIWKDSVDAVNGAIADLEEKRDYYAAETARRAGTYSSLILRGELHHRSGHLHLQGAS